MGDERQRRLGGGGPGADADHGRRLADQSGAVRADRQGPEGHPLRLGSNLDSEHAVPQQRRRFIAVGLERENLSRRGNGVGGAQAGPVDRFKGAQQRREGLGQRLEGPVLRLHPQQAVLEHPGEQRVAQSLGGNARDVQAIVVAGERAIGGKAVQQRQEARPVGGQLSLGQPGQRLQGGEVQLLTGAAHLQRHGRQAAFAGQRFGHPGSHVGYGQGQRRFGGQVRHAADGLQGPVQTAVQRQYKGVVFRGMGLHRRQERLRIDGVRRGHRASGMGDAEIPGGLDHCGAVGKDRDPQPGGQSDGGGDVAAEQLALLAEGGVAVAGDRALPQLGGRRGQRAHHLRGQTAARGQGVDGAVDGVAEPFPRRVPGEVGDPQGGIQADGLH